MTKTGREKKQTNNNSNNNKIQSFAIFYEKRHMPKRATLNKNKETIIATNIFYFNFFSSKIQNHAMKKKVNAEGHQKRISLNAFLRWPPVTLTLRCNRNYYSLKT